VRYIRRIFESECARRSYNGLTIFSVNSGLIGAGGPELDAGLLEMAVKVTEGDAEGASGAESDKAESRLDSTGESDADELLETAVKATEGDAEGASGAGLDKAESRLESDNIGESDADEIGGDTDESESEHISSTGSGELVVDGQTSE
jgi:hypothetical protein